MKGSFEKITTFLCSTILFISVGFLVYSFDDLKENLDIKLSYIKTQKEIEQKPFIVFENKEDEKKEILGKVYNSEEYLLDYIDKNLLDFLKEDGLRILILDENNLNQEFNDLTDNLYSKALKYGYVSKLKAEDLKQQKDRINQDGKVYIAGSFFYPEKSIVSYNNTDHIIHEIGHSIDLLKIEKINIALSNTEVFKEIFKREKDLFIVDKYYISNTSEYFAEYFSYFINNKDNEEFNNEMPLTYEYISTIYDYINTNKKIDKELLEILKSIDIENTTK